ncbi:MAG: hypothetical protein ABEK59_05600 [Halobacteria archaeon]
MHINLRKNLEGWKVLLASTTLLPVAVGLVSLLLFLFAEHRGGLIQAVNLMFLPFSIMVFLLSLPFVYLMKRDVFKKGVSALVVVLSVLLTVASGGFLLPFTAGMCAGGVLGYRETG